jgi:competence protein ComEC
MDNETYKKLILNNIIYIIYIFIIINLCIFSTNKIIYFLLLTIFFIYIRKKKNYFLFLLIVPSLKNFIFYFLINNFNKNILITYKVQNQVKKNLYMINIQGNINNNIINYENILLYSTNSKKFFVYYQSEVYIINKNILKEIEIYKIYSTYYTKLIEYLYTKILLCKKYNFILTNLLLGIKHQININNEKKEINEIYNLFKKTGTWHLLCIGGLHINIIRTIFYFIFILLIEIFYNPLKILRIINAIEIFLIGIYIFVIINNSYSIPIMRAGSFFFLNYFFYWKKIIINSLYILLITIWIFLFINTNYLYNIGFQMSFLCVYCLIGLGYLIEKLKKSLKKSLKSKFFNNWFLKGFINSFITNFFISLLLIIYHLSLHGSFNLLSIFANIILIPIFYIIIILSFLGIFNKVFWLLNIYLIKLTFFVLKVCYLYSINIYFKLYKKHINKYCYFIYLFITILLIFLYKFKINNKKIKNLDIINCNENKYNL